MPQSVLLQDLTKSFGWNERDAFQQHDVQARNCDNATVNSIDYRPLIHEGISSRSTMRCRNALSRQHSSECAASCRNCAMCCLRLWRLNLRTLV